MDPVIAASEIGLTLALQSALRKPKPLQNDVDEEQADWRECLYLSALARAVLSDGHGGALLVVPGETGAWKQSISLAHRFVPIDTSIRDLIRQNLRDEHAYAEASIHVSTMDLPDKTRDSLASALAYRPADLARVVRPYATLASVDGAVVVTKDMRFLGFGAKISADSPTGATVCLLRPLSGLQKAIPVPIAESGGMRHQSAVRFVLNHHNAVALVISQDRHLSIVNWEQEIDSVVMMRNAEWLE